MSALPPWAQTPIARKLIDTILADPPETFIRSNKLPSIYGGHSGAPEEVFSARTPSGKIVCRLRRIHNEWFERQIAALDAQFHVSGRWDDEASRALHQIEDADAVIHRLLKEQAEAPKSRAA